MITSLQLAAWSSRELMALIGSFYACGRKSLLMKLGQVSVSNKHPTVNRAFNVPPIEILILWAALRKKDVTSNGPSLKYTLKLYSIARGFTNFFCNRVCLFLWIRFRLNRGDGTSMRAECDRWVTWPYVWVWNCWVDGRNEQRLPYFLFQLSVFCVQWCCRLFNDSGIRWIFLCLSREVHIDGFHWTLYGRGGVVFWCWQSAIKTKEAQTWASCNIEEDRFTWIDDGWAQLRRNAEHCIVELSLYKREQQNRALSIDVANNENEKWRRVAVGVIYPLLWEGIHIKNCKAFLTHHFGDDSVIKLALLTSLLPRQVFSCRPAGLSLWWGYLVLYKTGW